MVRKKQREVISKPLVNHLECVPVITSNTGGLWVCVLWVTCICDLYMCVFYVRDLFLNLSSHSLSKWPTLGHCILCQAQSLLPLPLCSPLASRDPLTPFPAHRITLSRHFYAKQLSYLLYIRYWSSEQWNLGIIRSLEQYGVRRLAQTSFSRWLKV